MEMQDLMAQAKQLQDKVSAAQDLLGKTSVKGIAGNGECIVTMSGKYDLINLEIKPVLLERGTEHLTATITAAFNDAKTKADNVIDDIMGEATAGMPMPE
jgi:DNA-binding YbaB/EbfC family protein